MPALQSMTGCVGVSCWPTGSPGRCIATSAGDSEAAMQAGAAEVGRVRDRAAEVFQAATTVDEWQLAAVHRDHHSREGARVRATWLKVRPDQFDRAVEFYKTSVLPEIERSRGSAAAA